MTTLAEFFGEPIHVYTRAEALADGMLVNVSGLALEAGLRYPVAMTRAAWEMTVPVPVSCEGFQDETGRLWDVLWLARCAAKRQGGSRCSFTVSTITSKGGRRRNVHLEMVCGPGDDPSPVLTIQLPGED